MAGLLSLFILIALLVLVGWVLVRFTLAVLRWLAMNAIAGLIIIGLLNFMGITHVRLTPLNLLIIAVGGVVGAFIVIFLSII